ncbi:MAG: HXXEE domain-containing protein [Candidatus Delongbacteria bacterium]|nr:MAG: HXXEE domain-containing protein [Candidatus Delongbacteria bacterium]
MEKIEILIVLLPIVFMIHDFEEIIMFKPWLNKNKIEIKERFPKFKNFLSKKHYFNLSTSGFSIAVLHEFVLISLVTVLSLFYKSYDWWFGAFAVFSLHLFVHIIQWIIYGKYIPAIVTSILTLPYCIYTFIIFIETTKISQNQMLFWTLIGIVITVLSFPSAFYLAFKFEHWKNKSYISK